MKLRLTCFLVLCLLAQSTSFAMDIPSKGLGRHVRMAVAALAVGLPLKMVDLKAQEAPLRVEIPASLAEVSEGQKVSVGAFIRSVKPITYTAGGESITITPLLVIRHLENRHFLTVTKAQNVNGVRKLTPLSFDFATIAERQNKIQELQRDADQSGTFSLSGLDQSDRIVDVPVKQDGALDLQTLLVFRKEEGEVEKAIEADPANIRALKKMGTRNITFNLLDRRTGDKTQGIQIAIGMSPDGTNVGIDFGLDPTVLADQRVAGGERYPEFGTSMEKIVERAKDRDEQLASYEKNRGDVEPEPAPAPKPATDTKPRRK